MDRDLPTFRAVDTIETLALTEDEKLTALAEKMCDQWALAMRVNNETDACTFDPFEGYRDLKWSLIGDVRPVARLNLHYPPGVERTTKRGRRVYGVECAVKVDTQTGEMLIWRKDDIVNSIDTTDWMVATYHPVTGEFHERDVVTVHTERGDQGDTLTLQVAPPADHRYANRGYTTITGKFSSGYHAIDEVTATREAYYGRGVDPEANRVKEGNYSADLYDLHQALERTLIERGVSPEVLDHAPDYHRALGQYALVI